MSSGRSRVSSCRCQAPGELRAPATCASCAHDCCSSSRVVVHARRHGSTPRNGGIVSRIVGKQPGHVLAHDGDVGAECAHVGAAARASARSPRHRRVDVAAADEGDVRRAPLDEPSGEQQADAAEAAGDEVRAVGGHGGGRSLRTLARRRPCRCGGPGPCTGTRRRHRSRPKDGARQGRQRRRRRTSCMQLGEHRLDRRRVTERQVAEEDDVVVDVGTRRGDLAGVPDVAPADLEEPAAAASTSEAVRR